MEEKQEKESKENKELNRMCKNCACLNVNCNRAIDKVWTGCIYKKK